MIRVATWLALGVLALLTLPSAAPALGAARAGDVHVALVGTPAAAVAGRWWTAKLSVRPTSFSGTVGVIATGPKRIAVRATGRRGSYRAGLVFPAAGRWALTARAGGSTTRLGSVRVRPAPRRPVAFTQPTSIEVEPAGTLLLVENDPGRILRVDPQTGGVTVVVPAIARPYAVVRAPSGTVFFSAENLLRRIEPAGSLTTVAEAESDIGPLAVAPDGDVYYATETRVFRLVGGGGSPVHVAGTGVAGGGGDGGPAVESQVARPHGLAVAADGALLVSDTDNNRIRRIDRASGIVTTLVQVGSPRGLDIAGDGTIYVIDSIDGRLVHLSASGARIGSVGPVLAVPYDVEIAASSIAYVLEAGSTGWVRRIAPDGSLTTVSRP